MKIIRKNTGIKVLSLLFALFMVFALHPSVHASAAGTYSVTATTGNCASITMEVPNSVLYKGYFTFTCSGVPTNSSITSIVITLNSPNQSGAYIYPQTWTIERLSGSHSPMSATVPHSTPTITANNFNGQDPNGVWRVSFDAIVFRNGNYTVGALSYTKMNVKINWS